MREATIILPSQAFNGGWLSRQQRESALDCIADTFGRVTAVEGHGIWRAPDGTLKREPVTVLTIAVDDSEEGDVTIASQLREAAGQLAFTLDQDCVYLRLPSGNAERVRPLQPGVWVITEADRSATTLLLPTEY
jgi:hypothetical protein